MNFLSPMNFSFLLKRAPTVTFFLQECSIPGISLNTADTANPFVQAPYAGDHLTFEPLEIKFKVDEDMKNYLEIFKWMRGLGFPENFNQYKRLEEQKQYTGESVFSDITLTTMSSNKKNKYEITFVDCVPIYLSQVKFNTTDTDINYVTADCRFKYTYFNINACGSYDCAHD